MYIAKCMTKLVNNELVAVALHLPINENLKFCTWLSRRIMEKLETKAESGRTTEKVTSLLLDEGFFK